MVVPGFGYKLMRAVDKYLPDAVVRRMMAKKSGSIRDGR